MHSKFKGSVSTIAIAIFFICFSGKLFSQSTVSSHIKVNKGLKDYYSKYFPIGVAVNIRSLQGEDSALIVTEFNSITPENDMKIGPIHPAEDEFNWENADSIVALLKETS
ncbi:MAG: endo-1,4-beta-xylanase [Segetibacter sp.]